MKIIGLLAILLSLQLSGCMIVGKVAGGKTSTFEKDYVVKTPWSADENMTRFKETLYTLGWQKIEEDGFSATFLHEPPLLTEITLSRIEKHRIMVLATNDGIEVELVQYGNFKNGTEEKVDRTFQRIRMGFLNGTSMKSSKRGRR